MTNLPFSFNRFGFAINLLRLLWFYIGITGKYGKFSVSLLVIVQKVVGKTAKKVCAVGMIPVELVEETEIYVWFFAFPVERDADVMTLAPVL